MEELSFIKECYKKFLSSSVYGSYVEENSMSFIKSGSSSKDMNVCIIDKISNFNNQKQSFQENFNVNGFVLSIPSSRFMVQHVGDNLTHYGKVGIMRGKGFASNNIFNNIKRIDANNSNDFVQFISQQRDIERQILLGIVDSVGSDMHIYMAYENDEPIGAGYAIEHEKNIFILDTIVKDEKRNSGILSAIGEYSMSNATKSGISNFLSLVSSDYSQRVAEKMGYSEALILDFWINKES